MQLQTATHFKYRKKQPEPRVGIGIDNGSYHKNLMISIVILPSIEAAIMVIVIMK